MTCLLLAATAAGPSAAAALLTVRVENLRSDRGTVHIAIWSGEEGFTDKDAALLLERAPAARGARSVTFEGLPAGRYAVAVFHDENGNGEFDRTLIGLPAEGLGFSNGAWIDLGPPRFDEAAVEFPGRSTTIVVPLRY